MRPFALLALGAAAYGVFLAAGLPAALVAPRVESASGGRLRLEQASGTVWNGAARARVSMPSASFVLDEVRWRFLPSRLAIGRAAAQVSSRAGRLAVDVELARSPGAWRLEDLHAKGDASALALFVPLMAAWQPAGPVEIEAPLLTLDGGALSGRASARWSEGALSLSPVRPLGSWHAQLDAGGGPARIEVTTDKGPLRIAGTGTLAADGRLAFTGEARSEPGREGELAPLLQLFGPRRADGAHSIEVR